jgi:hypothetical protein
VFASFIAVDTHIQDLSPSRFDRANYYVRESTITLGRVLVLVLLAYFVVATVLHGHPPFTLSWFRT